MIDESVFRAWAEIDDAGTAGNPWGITAVWWRNETGGTIAEAVDRAIVAAMQISGDMRPLAALLYLGHAPGANVLRLVAKMIAPELIGPRNAYSIKTKRNDGKAGRARAFEDIVRDACIDGVIAKRQAIDGTKYDAAIAELAPALGMSVEAVRKAQSRGRHGN